MAVYCGAGSMKRLTKPVRFAWHLCCGAFMVAVCAIWLCMVIPRTIRQEYSHFE